MSGPGNGERKKMEESVRIREGKEMKSRKEGRKWKKRKKKEKRKIKIRKGGKGEKEDSARCRQWIDGVSNVL